MPLKSQPLLQVFGTCHCQAAPGALPLCAAVQSLGSAASSPSVCRLHSGFWDSSTRAFLPAAPLWPPCSCCYVSVHRFLRVLWRGVIRVGVPECLVHPRVFCLQPLCWPCAVTLRSRKQACNSQLMSMIGLHHAALTSQPAVRVFHLLDCHVFAFMLLG